MVTLRRELISQGAICQSTTDTEVILHLRADPEGAADGDSRSVANDGDRLQSAGVAAQHVLFLASLRSRIAVAFEWMWAYLTFRRSTRLISS